MAQITVRIIFYKENYKLMKLICYGIVCCLKIKIKRIKENITIWIVIEYHKNIIYI